VKVTLETYSDKALLPIGSVSSVFKKNYFSFEERGATKAKK